MLVSIEPIASHELGSTLSKMARSGSGPGHFFLRLARFCFPFAARFAIARDGPPAVPALDAETPETSAQRTYGGQSHN